MLGSSLRSPLGRGIEALALCDNNQPDWFETKRVQKLVEQRGHSWSVCFSISSSLCSSFFQVHLIQTSQRRDHQPRLLAGWTTYTDTKVTKAQVSVRPSSGHTLVLVCLPPLCPTAAFFVSLLLQRMTTPCTRHHPPTTLSLSSTETLWCPMSGSSTH